MLLHSDVARLVLGYLAEEDCPLTYQSFVKESIHLKEMKNMLLQEFESGSPRTIFGKSLCIILNEYYTMKDAESQFINFKNKPHGRKQKFLLMWKKLEEAMTAVKSFQVASILDGLQSKKMQCASCTNQMSQTGVVVTQSTPSDFLWNDKPTLYRHLLPETDEQGVFKESSVFQAPSEIEPEPTDSLIQAVCNRRKKRLGLPKRLSDVERKNKVAQLKPDSSNFILHNIARSEGMAVVGATIMTQMKKCARTEKPLDTSPSQSPNIDADAAKHNQESIAQLSLESLLQTDFTDTAIEFEKELENLLELEDSPIVSKTVSQASSDSTVSEPDPKLFILGNPVVVNLPRQAESQKTSPNSPSLSEALLIPSITRTSFDNSLQSNENNVNTPTRDSASSSAVDSSNTEAAIATPAKEPNTSGASVADQVEVNVLPNNENCDSKIEERTKIQNCDSQENSVQGGDNSSIDAGPDLSPMETIIQTCDAKTVNKSLPDDAVIDRNLSSSAETPQDAASNPPFSCLMSALEERKPSDLVEASTIDIDQNIGKPTCLTEETLKQEVVSSYRSPKKSSRRPSLHLIESPAKNTRSKSKVLLTRTKLRKKNAMPKIKMKSKYKDRKKKPPTKSQIAATKNSGSETSCQSELQVKSPSAESNKTDKIFPDVEQPQQHDLRSSVSPSKCSSNNSNSPENILVAVSLQSAVTSPRKLTLRYGLRATGIHSKIESKTRKSPLKGKKLFDDRTTNRNEPQAATISSNLADVKEDLMNELLVGGTSNVEKVDGVMDVASNDLSEMKTVNHIPTTSDGVHSTSSTKSQTSCQAKPDSNKRTFESFTVPKSGVLIVDEHQDIKMGDILQQLTAQVKKAKDEKGNTFSTSVVIPVTTIAAATVTSSTSQMPSFSNVMQPKSNTISLDCAATHLPHNQSCESHTASASLPTRTSPNIIISSFAATQSSDVLSHAASFDSAKVNKNPVVSVDDRVFADLCKKDVTGESLTMLLNETSLTQMIDAATDMQEYMTPGTQKTTTEETDPSCTRFRTISPSAGVFSVFETENPSEVFPVATTAACESIEMKSETEEATRNLRAWLNSDTLSHADQFSETIARPLSFAQPIIRRPRYRKLIPKLSAEGISGTYVLPVRSKSSNFSGAVKKPLLVQNNELVNSNQRSSGFIRSVPDGKSPAKRKSRSFAKDPNPVAIGFTSSATDIRPTCDTPTHAITISSTSTSRHRPVTPRITSMSSNVIVGVPLHSLLTNPCNHSSESTLFDGLFLSKPYDANTRAVNSPSINVSSMPSATDVSAGSVASSTISLGLPPQSVASLTMSTKLVSSFTALPKLATEASPSVKQFNQSLPNASAPSLLLTDSNPLPSHATSAPQAMSLPNASPQSKKRTIVLENIAKVAEENTKWSSAETTDDFSQITSSEEGRLRILTSDDEKNSPIPSISGKKRKIKPSEPSVESEAKRQRYDIQGMSEVDIVQLLNELHGKKSEKKHSKKHKKHKKKSKKKDKAKKNNTKSKSFEFSSERNLSVSDKAEKVKSSNNTPVTLTSLALHEINENNILNNNTAAAQHQHKKVSSKKIVSVSPLKTENRGKRRVSLTSIPIPPSKLGGSPLHLRTPSPAVCRDSPKTIALVAESLVELSRSHSTVHKWETVGGETVTETQTAQAQHSQPSPCSGAGTYIPESSSQSSVCSRTPPSSQTPKKKSKRKQKKLSLETLDISKFLSTLDYK